MHFKNKNLQRIELTQKMAQAVCQVIEDDREMKERLKLIFSNAAEKIQEIILKRNEF